MVMCLGQGADLTMAQLLPLPLTISCSSKSRLVLRFWCRVTWIVLDKIQKAVKQACVCGRYSLKVTFAITHCMTPITFPRLQNLWGAFKPCYQVYEYHALWEQSVVAHTGEKASVKIQQCTLMLI